MQERNYTRAMKRLQLPRTGQITFRLAQREDHSLVARDDDPITRKGVAHPAKRTCIYDYASGLARRLARQVRPVLIAIELYGNFKTSRFGSPVLRFCMKKSDGRERSAREREGRRILINYLTLARVRASYRSAYK